MHAIHFSKSVTVSMTTWNSAVPTSLVCKPGATTSMHSTVADAAAAASNL